MELPRRHTLREGNIKRDVHSAQLNHLDQVNVPLGAGFLGTGGEGTRLQHLALVRPVPVAEPGDPVSKTDGHLKRHGRMFEGC